MYYTSVAFLSRRSPVAEWSKNGEQSDQRCKHSRFEDAIDTVFFF